MKYLKFIGLIVASVMLVSCGSSGGGGTDVSSGTSTITIAIGGSGQASIVEPKEDTMFAKVMEFVDILSPAEAVAGTISPSCDNPAIPDLDVFRILIMITGDGIPSGSPITEEVLLTLPDDHCDAVIRTFTVPNGTGIVFHADALNGSGDRIYEGTTVKDINGADFVQIFMEKSCDLFVDVETGRDFSEGINDCTDRANPCESITHPLTHPDIDASNRVICVASGVYDEEYGNEDFPILLKNGTEIRCEGENHTSVIAQFDSYSWDNPTIGVVDGAISASINGCRVVVDDGETGISDSGANLTVDNCLIIGGYMDDDPQPTYGSVGIELSGDSTVRNSEIWYNEVGIDVIGGDPDINNNHLSCNGLGEGGIDLKIDNRSLSAINAQNNAWDNIPVVIETQCTYDGTDICIFEGIPPDLGEGDNGPRLADDGCPRFIPEPECLTDFDCPEEFMICTEGICELSPVTCVPSLISPAEGAIMDNGGPDCQDPMVWNFDWSSCPDEGATYDIQILGGALPIVASGRTVSNHTFNYPLASYPDFRLTGWTWQVRATEFGQTGEWSQPRSFSVEPANEDCIADPICGDGYTDPDEECDDGNTTPGDGCENDCTITPASECPAPSVVMNENVPTQLGGALNVNINDELWDATFYYSWSSSLQFYNIGTFAEDASSALNNLFDSPAFNLYDTNPAMVWGCGGSVCYMVTPVVDSPISVGGYSFVNAGGTDQVSEFTSYTKNPDSRISFVQWSLSDCQ